MGFGATEWIIIALVVLLLFGAKKIPELARGLGQGINEFRKASSEIRKEIEKGNEETEKAANEKNKDEAVK
ncbi:MAG: twin-arginine translocase TatA/TatE family subunit [Balneolales bacterium]|nr:twin-arginine translocase TatA/TatE family subunit [Balneolales bacterium]